jgi:hypothetical protein
LQNGIAEKWVRSFRNDLLDPIPGQKLLEPREWNYMATYSRRDWWQLGPHTRNPRFWSPANLLTMV